MAIILYLAIVMILFAISVLFNYYSTYLAFLLAVIIPFCSFMIMVINRICIVIKADTDKNAVSKGEKVNINIKVKNRGIFVSGEIVACIELFYGNHSRILKKICFNSLPMQKGIYSVDIVAEYAGELRISCKKIILYDYLKLFKLRFSKGKSEYKINVLPRPVPLDVIYTENENGEIVETVEYHQNKKGYDKTEIFDVREYRQGDDLKDVHWKLTEKMDRYMVKEYSMPISANLGIMVDITEYKEGFQSVVINDKLMELAYSICKSIVISNGKCEIFSINKSNGRLIREIVGNEAELELAISRIIDVMTVKTEDKLENVGALFDGCRQNNVVYITSEISEQLVEIAFHEMIKRKIIIILVTDAEADTEKQLEKFGGQLECHVVSTKQYGMGNVNEIRF